MSYFSSLFKTEFSKNVLTLMTGTTIAQAIPIAITPILTRLYTPEDFGVFALFMSITAILGVISSGKFEEAIVLPKSEKESLNLVYLSFFVSSIFSFFFLILVLLLRKQISFLLELPKIENWLFFIPISVFFIGIFNSLRLYNVRIKNYKKISSSLVSKSTGLILIQLGVGLLRNGAFGLIVGQLFSYFAGILILLNGFFKSTPFVGTYDKIVIKQVFITYKRFPQFTLPGSLLNSLTLNSINFLISVLYSTSILGFFSLARRLLSLPSNIIGGSISQVFFQELSEVKNNNGKVLNVFNVFLRRLVFISIPIFTIAYFLVEPVFIFFFGNNWGLAGEYAKIIVPLAGVRFISSTLSSTLHVFQKQQYTLLIQTIQFITILLVFWYSNVYDLSFKSMLLLYVQIFIFEYILFAVIYWQVVKKNELL